MLSLTRAQQRPLLQHQAPGQRTLRGGLQATWPRSREDYSLSQHKYRLFPCALLLDPDMTARRALHLREHPDDRAVFKLRPRQFTLNVSN